MAHGLSKSKLMSFRQCQKKLWLDKHRPEFAGEGPEREARFDAGHEIGDIAQRPCDTGGGVLIEYDTVRRAMVERTNETLKKL